MQRKESNIWIKQSTDTVLTTLLLMYGGYFAFMGIVFGGLSHENHVPYIILTIIGLILIWISSLVKAIKILIWTRFIGLVLMHSLLYFNIKVSGGIGEPWEFVKLISLGYLPIIIYILFSVYHVLKLSSINKEKAANTGLPKA